MKKTHEFEEGTIRIKSNDFEKYIKKNHSWEKHTPLEEEISKIIEKYIKNKNHPLLFDPIDQSFLKGNLSKEKKIQGSKIMHLPNGKKLARGGFSLFAKNLKINLNKKPLWDICYENTSGSKTYLYNEDNIHIEQKQKAKLVDQFEENFENIKENLLKDIKNKKENLNYLILYTLIITKIRIGNIEYYNNLKHKGLTTLQNKDVSIKNNKITFEFIGKDGIPHKINKDFPEIIIKEISKLKKSKKNNEFLFTKSNNTPIHTSEISKILFKYTKKHFYPHIIRSHFADIECYKFIKNNKKATKKEVESKFLEIAKELGHKKFNKKTNSFEPNFKVTVTSYIRPKYYENMIKLYQKK